MTIEEKEDIRACLIDVLEMINSREEMSNAGLCTYALDLADGSKECIYIDFMQSHKPKFWSRHYCWINPDRDYWYYWPKYKKEPRIKWLKYWIKKLS
jgi:hypothetical protein